MLASGFTFSFLLTLFIYSIFYFFKYIGQLRTANIAFCSLDMYYGIKHYLYIHTDYTSYDSSLNLEFVYTTSFAIFLFGLIHVKICFFCPFDRLGLLCGLYCGIVFIVVVFYTTSRRSSV